MQKVLHGLRVFIAGAGCTCRFAPSHVVTGPSYLGSSSVEHNPVLLDRSAPEGSVSLGGGNNASLLFESFFFHNSILKVLSGTALRP